MERREFLTWGAGLAAAALLPGCGRREATVRTAEELLAGFPGRAAQYRPAEVLRPEGRAGGDNSSAGGHARAGGPGAGRITAISREAWRADTPIPSRLRPMGRVSRVTIHHEGNPEPWISDSTAAVAARLRQIQDWHRRNLRAGDIGYHFIVDRAGRVWQGRSVQYQGAHVGGRNEHNIGVMVLGNFEIQQPTAPQVTALATLCGMLVEGYGISRGDLFAHRDLASTCCPGKRLLPHVNRMKHTLAFA
jgi:hypothetical protein